jgi:hypothetical protein
MIIYNFACVATRVAWAARDMVIDLLGRDGKAAPSAIYRLENRFDWPRGLHLFGPLPMGIVPA